MANTDDTEYLNDPGTIEELADERYVHVRLPDPNEHPTGYDEVEDCLSIAAARLIRRFSSIHPRLRPTFPKLGFEWRIPYLNIEQEATDASNPPLERAGTTLSSLHRECRRRKEAP